MSACVIKDCTDEGRWTLGITSPGQGIESMEIVVCTRHYEMVKIPTRGFFIGTTGD